MSKTLQVNEITDIELILCHLDEEDWDNFCHAWYIGLDSYKENADALLIMANAILAYWNVPLYAINIAWAEENDCFIWHFGDNTSPDYL